jgi:hypothetical protein
MNDDGLDLGADDGFAAVTINGHTERLDVFGTLNRFARLPRGEGEVEASQALMRELGFGPCSDVMVGRLVQALLARGEGLKKKHFPSPDSPASTG